LYCQVGGAEAKAEIEVKTEAKAKVEAEWTICRHRPVGDDINSSLSLSLSLSLSSILKATIHQLNDIFLIFVTTNCLFLITLIAKGTAK